jgi:hypothetical protein
MKQARRSEQVCLYVQTLLVPTYLLSYDSQAGSYQETIPSLLECSLPEDLQLLLLCALNQNRYFVG